MNDRLDADSDANNIKAQKANKCSSQKDNLCHKLFYWLQRSVFR